MEDPDYQVIEGAWLNEEPYGVVHRITSDGTVKGAASACLTWAFGQCGNLKIDTHRDNVVMQNMLKKMVFNPVESSMSRMDQNVWHIRRRSKSIEYKGRI